MPPIAKTFAELWQYRELFFFLTWRDIMVRYKQTVLGVLWALIQPLSTMLVFAMLFGKLGKMPTNGVPYPLFYFSALLPWIYFSTTLSQSANSLVGNVNLLTKIYFPRVILPGATVIGGLLDFLVGSIVLIGFIIYYRISLGWSVFLWPVLVMLLLTLTLGGGMILAALNVKYRDVKHAVPFAIQLCLFITPVIYPLGLIPERFRIWVALNPLTGIIESFRQLFSGQVIDYSLLTWAALITGVIFIAGVVYFGKTERAFADII